MWPSYSDIRLRLGEPLWYDEYGVPRYEPFNPRMCNVYAKYAALMLVECQECGREFKVAKTREFKVAKTLELLDMVERDDFLPTALGTGAFHYGDAPRHGCAGDTMNVITRKILEFWQWDFKPGIKNVWWRCPEYEFEYPEDEEGE